VRDFEPVHRVRGRACLHWIQLSFWSRGQSPWIAGECLSNKIWNSNISKISIISWSSTYTPWVGQWELSLLPTIALIVMHQRSYRNCSRCASYYKFSDDDDDDDVVRWYCRSHLWTGKVIGQVRQVCMTSTHEYRSRNRIYLFVVGRLTRLHSVPEAILTGWQSVRSVALDLLGMCGEISVE